MCKKRYFSVSEEPIVRDSETGDPNEKVITEDGFEFRHKKPADIAEKKRQEKVKEKLEVSASAIICLCCRNFFTLVIILMFCCGNNFFGAFQDGKREAKSAGESAEGEETGRRRRFGARERVGGQAETAG